MLLSAWRYATGHLDVEIRGACPEALVNLAVAAGMDLWDLRRRPGRLVARIRSAAFTQLRPLCRRTRCRVRIRRRSGLPFLWRRLARRQGLLFGCLLPVLALFWFASHVWVIEVRGAELLDIRALRAGVADLGLKPGARRSQVRIPAIEQELPLQMPGVAWATVRLQGIRAVVEVVEKAAARSPAVSGQRVDLVARDRGVIEEVIVFQGYPRVRPGDVVAPGQLLVEGMLWAHSAPIATLPGQPKPPPDRAVRPVTASARVIARRWHSDYEEVPLETEVREPTGRQTRAWILKVGDRSIKLKGALPAPDRPAEVASRSWRLPGWRNWVPPVELSTLSAAEVNVRRQQITPDAAKAQATQRYLDRVRWRLAPEDRIVSVQTEVVQVGSAFLGVRTTVETLEDIGQPAAPPAGAPEKPPGR